MKITIALDGDDTKTVIHALEMAAIHYHQRIGRKDLPSSDWDSATQTVIDTERLAGAFETALKAEQGAQQP